MKADVANLGHPVAWRFDGFRVQRLARRVLDREGRELALRPRAFDALVLLLEHQGEVLDKDQMLAALWPGRVVEENNLNQAICAVRHALGSDGHEHRHILTVAGRGYCFVAAAERKLDMAPSATTPTGTSSLAAHRLYLAGRHHMDNARTDEFDLAISHFRQAIELDPVFALAWAALGEAYRRLPLAADAPPLQAFPLARAAAHRALTIEPDLALAHATLGWIAFWHAWEWDAAEGHFRHAIALAPEMAEAHLGLAHLLTNLGRFEAALPAAAVAARLDPFSPIITTITASFLGAAGRIEVARATLDEVIHTLPTFWVALLHRAELSLADGAHQRALDDLELARERSRGSIQVLGPLGYTLARLGRVDEARALLAVLHAGTDRQFVPPSALAMILAGLGEAEAALDALERAREVRDVRLTFLRRDTAWRDLRGRPRFHALARSLALADPRPADCA